MPRPPGGSAENGAIFQPPMLREHVLQFLAKHDPSYEVSVRGAHSLPRLCLPDTQTAQSRQ